MNEFRELLETFAEIGRLGADADGDTSHIEDQLATACVENIKTISRALELAAGIEWRNFENDPPGNGQSFYLSPDENWWFDSSVLPAPPSEEEK